MREPTQPTPATHYNMSFLKRLKAALATRARTLSPSCREAVRLQSLALDGRLTLGQRFGLRMHLLLCKWCRRYGRQLRFLRESVRTESDAFIQAPPRGLSSDTRERIKRSLSDSSR